MNTTNRRAFLKAGALVAAPIGVLAPTIVLAASDGGTAARLAKLEDEQAITGLTRDALRRFNAGETFGFDPAISAITPDAQADPVIEIAADGTSASLRQLCAIDRSIAFSGNSTIERMARFQGQAAASTGSSGTLDARLVRLGDGWEIERLSIV